MIKAPLEIEDQVAEALLTTKGEKGDTGAKGDRGPQGPAGTPSISQALSMLGLKAKSVEYVNKTFTFTESSHTQNWNFINYLGTTENSSPLIVIHSLSCIGNCTTSDGYVYFTIYSHGWVTTSGSYRPLDLVFNGNISGIQTNQLIGNISNHAVLTCGYNNTIFGLMGSGRCSRAGPTLQFTGSYTPYIPAWDN